MKSLEVYPPMSESRRKWASGLYWIGVVMTLTCIALVLAGNSEALHRFEHTGLPLSWALGGVAIIAFLGAEFGLHEKPAESKVKPVRRPEPVQDLDFPAVRGKA